MSQFIKFYFTTSINLYIQTSLVLSWRHTYGQDTCLCISTVTLVDRQCKHTTVSQELPTFWLVKKRIGRPKATIQEGWSTSRCQEVRFDNGKVIEVKKDPITGPMWVEVYLSSSKTAALNGGEWPAASPGRTLHPGKTWYPSYRRLGGPHGRPGWAENLVPIGNFFNALYWSIKYKNQLDRLKWHRVPSDNSCGTEECRRV